MPYGMRVLCAMAGGVLLMFGWLFGHSTASYDEASSLDLLGAAVSGGLGIGLLATAFLRRD